MSAIRLLFPVFLVACIAIGQGKPPQKLIGGVITEIGDFPFVVSIRSSRIHLCGGSIIDEKHILTAAHCIVNVDRIVITEIQVKVGFVDLTNKETAQYHEVSAIVIHRDYDPDEYKNDIAILTLTESIEYSDYVKPVSLTSLGRFVVGLNATVIGWGSSNTESQNLSRYQRKITMTILSKALCEIIWSTLDHESKICALGVEDHLLSNGDSGGPLVYDDTIIGIASASGVSFFRNYPAVFTRVEYHYKWIIENIRRY